MANVQTRRSISFALADYEAAQALAIAMGIPLAQLAAQALREFVARRSLPPPPDLQAELDKRVGVLPREPFTVADVHCAVGMLAKPENQAPRVGRDVVVPIESGSIMDRMLAAEERFAGEVFTTPGDSDGDVVSQGWKLGNDGVTPVRRDDEADHPDAGEVRVVYDEET